MKVLCADIETNGFLPELKTFHCAEFRCPISNEVWTFTNLKKLEAFLRRNKHYKLVFHNGECYDKPALNKLGIVVENEIIDTLALSYYLHPYRAKHGLASWGELIGILKPPVDDWSDQPIEVYLHRVKEDVKIQTALWHKFWPRLLGIYDGSEKDALRLIRYLNWKMTQQRFQENNQLRLDEPAARKYLAEWEGYRDIKKVELESVMPKVAVVKTKTRPALMFKMNRDPTKNNLKWFAFLTENGILEEDQKELLELEYISGYDEPNSNSHKQVKDWLYGLGWKPETFKKVKDDIDPEELKKLKDAAKKAVKGTRRKPRWVKPYKERYIPQILTEDKDICPSIVRLAETVPEVKALEGLGVLNHRIGFVNGFIKASAARGGIIQARMHGFTNTLRLKHAELVNIPSGRKKYGKELRSLLLADIDGLLLGSDLSSLEDRLKHHFQWPLDPDYVKTQMADDFDPHLLMAVMAALMAQIDSDWYKWAKGKGYENLSDKDKARFKVIDGIRHQGKGCNYSAQYGAGAAGIAGAAGVTLDIGELLHEAYKKLNWSIKAIADAVIVKKDASGQKWLWNPISKLWYYLKADKDKFSTLVQGSAAYIFDMWVYYANKLCLERFGRELPLAATFHDELVLKIKDTDKSKELMEKLVLDAISMLNSKHKLNRAMAADVAFGKTYYAVH